MRRGEWILACVLVLAGTSFARATPTATLTATPVRTPTVLFFTGWEIGTNEEFTTCIGGENPGAQCTVDSQCPSGVCLVPGANISIDSTLPRTGRYAMRLAVAAGANGWDEVPVWPYDLDTFVRVYVRNAPRCQGGANAGANCTVDSACPASTCGATRGDGRTLLGFWVEGPAQYGCRVDLEPDDGLSLRYRDRITYEPLGYTPIGILAPGAYHAVELFQSGLSGSSCMGSCTVLCELFVDGFKLLSTAITSVIGAQCVGGTNAGANCTNDTECPGGGVCDPGDYDLVSAAYVGSAGSGNGTLDILYDDFAVSYQDRVGLGRVEPLYPSADGTLTDWGRSGSNTCDTCDSTHEALCASDWKCGLPDDDTSYLQASVADKTQNLALTNLATLATGEAVGQVRSIVSGCETNAGATAPMHMNQVVGVSVATGSNFDPTVTCPTYQLGGLFTTVVDPSTASPWTEGGVNNLFLQLVKDTSTSTNRITAALAVVDITSPTPPAVQNLQDWSGDGRLTIAALGDSTTNGQGLGTCRLRPAVPCTQNTECRVCADDTTIACTSSADCPGACMDYAPCSNTGKYPTQLATYITQQFAGITTVLNCGIGGNTALDMEERLPDILTGVGVPADRYCMQAGTMPTACTCNTPTTVKQCASVDCAPQTNGKAWCATTCDLALGSKVCSGNHSRDCAADSDCPGVGTCSDFPGADYVLLLAGGNDVRLGYNVNCNLGNITAGPPCPPMSTSMPTPQATPTPGSYACQRITCNATTECAVTTGGLCSNDLTKACDADGDCTPGTCNHGLARGGNSQCAASCSGHITSTCGAAADCGTGETCTATKICTCPCSAIPCVTDVDCGPAILSGSANARANLTQYGSCVGGKCFRCGPPGYRYLCSGDRVSSCTVQADCNFAGGTCSEESTQYVAARRVINADWSLGHHRAIADLVANATPARRLIDLTYLRTLEAPRAYDATWHNTRDDLRALRWHLLNGDIVPNVVDVLLHQLWADRLVTPYRCNNAPGIICASAADCSSGATCVDFGDSTLRSWHDPVHLNALGTATISEAVSDYLGKLRPVCSGDTMAGCGQCGGAGTPTPAATPTAPYPSPWPTANCATSASCASAQKCRAADGVCIAASKGTCTQERAGNLCTLDLSMTCSTNGDCTGKGICRPEGLSAPGEG